ncbi:hypothetical protein D9758_012365 [Tetrapyrgos nigripes]|uniref:DUF6699 domain-containing protein n=1 Tax=Tetrapyrgos nigripes TaxID=182062 RepID=A0A8H5CNS1_9AGAR|nr:hypothetical protein D9758_012365 [Tetrapyrgos nigripes]
MMEDKKLTRTSSSGKRVIDGPVLTQTDLFLLNCPLELNPILTQTSASFQLVFNIVTGHTGGFNPEARDRDLPFTSKDEPATIPRVNQLMIITNMSPWCTIVKNDEGVNLGDICTQIWKDYAEGWCTDGEIASLPPRLQEQVKRASAARTQGWAGGYYTPAAAPTRHKRIDWLRDRIFFERLHKEDNYAASRLGFRAPNIFQYTLLLVIPVCSESPCTASDLLRASFQRVLLHVEVYVRKSEPQRKKDATHPQTVQAINTVKIDLARKYQSWRAGTSSNSSRLIVFTQRNNICTTLLCSGGSSHHLIAYGPARRDCMVLWSVFVRAKRELSRKGTKSKISSSITPPRTFHLDTSSVLRTRYSIADFDSLIPLQATHNVSFGHLDTSGLSKHFVYPITHYSTMPPKHTLSFIPRVSLNSAPILEQLRYPYQLSDPAGDVDRILRDGVLDMDDYERELLALRAKMLSVENRRQMLKKHMDLCQSLRSPIRKLPVEIMNIIFSLCVTNKFGEHWGYWNNYRGENCLTARWPTLLLSMLWCHLAIREKANTALRSGTHPLAVDIDLYDCETRFASLIQESHRWSYLRLTHVGDERRISRFEKLISSGALTQLKTLKVCSENASPAVLDLFKGCGQLTSFSTDMHLFRFENYTFPWSQIRDLELRAIAHCPSLVSLHLDCESWNYDKIEEPEVEFPELDQLAQTSHSIRHLKITLDGPEIAEKTRDCTNALGFLLSCLTLPSLESLAIAARSYCTGSLFDKGENWPTKEVEAFFHDLTADQSYGDQSDRTLSLRLIKCLHTSDYDSFSSNSPRVLPRLQRINFTIHGSNSQGDGKQGDLFDDAAFLDMVRSRWVLEDLGPEDSGVACLKSVAFHIVGRPMRPELGNEVRLLEEGGLGIMVSHYETEEEEEEEEEVQLGDGAQNVPGQ